MWVIKSNGLFCGSVINTADFVVDMGPLRAHHAKAMGKSDGNIELFMLISIEINTLPFSEIGRIRPDIDSNIKNFSLQDRNQLRLTRLALVMQAPDHPCFRKGQIVLDELALDPVICVAVLTITFFKKPPLII